MGNTYASWTYTWKSLLKTDQQMPAYMDIHILSKLIFMLAWISIHVYNTDIHTDSSIWVPIGTMTSHNYETLIPKNRYFLQCPAE